MPAPDRGELANDINTFRAFGVDRVVSLLAEDHALGLAGEAEACAAAGLCFTHSPIVDFGLPEVETLDALARMIAAEIHAGQGVAVHCKAGIGRSGMVCSAILIHLGWRAADAVSAVSRARGVRLPDTVEQGRFIAEFEERCLRKHRARR